ncbi:MAG: nucleotidyltransferase family protein [Minisyncoccia bacterium]
MQVVILAAGRGIRMAELTNDLPKPLLRINGRPILEYTLANLPEEISEIIFVIGYKGDLIKAHFGDYYKDKKIRYVLQENLNGTAAALHCAKGFLQEKFLVLNGDDLYDRSDLRKIINNDLAILAKEVNNPARFGVIKTDKNGYLLEIIEKPTADCGNLVNTGAYFLNRNFFSYEMVRISEKEFGLPQTLARMAKDYKVKVKKANFWQPIGYPEDILKAEKIISSHNP